MTVIKIKQLFAIKTALLISLLFNNVANAGLTTKGVIDASILYNETPESWLKPWFENGVGVHRYDDEITARLNHALLEIDYELTNDLSFFAVAQYTPDGDTHLGVNEAYIKYKPLTNKIKHELKVGYFYPQLSLENSDIGWTSPYTFNFSSINSWVAEEVRPLGIEWQVKRPGRAHNSNFTYTGVVSAYAQNDGIASLLAWRGWAIHNRQTLIGEKVRFANYFQFQPVEAPNPTYVDINDETDHRVGYYVGLHVQYQRKTDLRAYYYDNNADPLSIESDMQYGWDTQFFSLALLHKFNREFRLLAQVMTGKTKMGDIENGVFNDFRAWYVMLNYKLAQHRYSIRHDAFRVLDKDNNEFDPNSSDGKSVTLSYRYEYSDNWQLGTELTITTSDNTNRTLWLNWTPKHTQKSFALTAQYRF